MFRSLMGDFYEPFPLRNRMNYDLVDCYTNPSYFHENFVHPRRQTRTSDTEQSDSIFKVMLNVRHFQRNEIVVKTVDNFVVVHGKHGELADDHGFVSREFKRRYRLPEDVDPDKVTSSLSKNGILTIEAPRKNEKVIPITIQQHAAVEEAQKTQVQQQQPPEEPQKQEQEQPPEEPQKQEQPPEEPQKQEQEQPPEEPQKQEQGPEELQKQEKEQ